MLQRRVDGRSLLAIMSDPFIDGLGDLGVNDPIGRGRVAEAAARARAGDLRDAIARAHDVQQAADAKAAKEKNIVYRIEFRVRNHHQQTGLLNRTRI